MRETDDDFVTKVDTAIEMKDRAEAAWQPIETAPKDGTLIMIWWLPLRYDGSLLHPEKELAAGHIMDGIRYDADLQTWMRGGTYADYRNNIKPTHWMPLPAPPSNPIPARTPSPEAVAKPKQFEFDHPYSAVFKDGLVGRWLELRAHGVSVESFAVAAWGSEPACIAAAWRHVYGDDAPAPTPETVARTALEWAAKRIVTHERGSVMHSPPALLTEAHDTLCDAASDPATIAAIIKTAEEKKDE